METRAATWEKVRSALTEMFGDRDPTTKKKVFNPAQAARQLARAKMLRNGQDPDDKLKFDRQRDTLDRRLRRMEDGSGRFDNEFLQVVSDATGVPYSAWFEGDETPEGTSPIDRAKAIGDLVARELEAEEVIRLYQCLREQVRISGMTHLVVDIAWSIMEAESQSAASMRALDLIRDFEHWRDDGAPGWSKPKRPDRLPSRSRTIRRK